MWKPIAGFEHYRVNEYGQVQNKNGKVLALRTNNKGYIVYALRKDRMYFYLLAHRLVALAFIDNPMKHPEVNHKDEDPLNNHVSNLEWCTHQYNMTYGTLQERKGKKKRIPMLQMSRDGETIAKWDCAITASEQTGIGYCNIHKAASGANNTAGGFKWKKIEDESGLDIWPKEAI